MAHTPAALVFWGVPGGLPSARNGGCDNNVYVVDASQNRVVKLNASGQVVSSWGSTGADDGQFAGPQGIAIHPDGRVFVSDSGNDRIQVFSEHGDFAFDFGHAGSGNGELQSPSQITFDALGNDMCWTGVTGVYRNLATMAQS